MLNVAEEIRAPLFANMVQGGRTPILSAERLHKMGYSIAIHPAIGFLSVGAALQKAYANLEKNGVSTSEIDLYSFSEFNKLVGFEDVWAFEKKFAQD
jgi:2-methylisocitrate lyase-like PEP mutase family enzyme